MRIKLLLSLFTLVASVNAQKITRILGEDSTRYSKNGIWFTKPGHRMIIEGIYNGKDLYMSNSFGPGGIGYCISEVKVNKNITADEVNAEIFRIDLLSHKLKLGESFSITVFYKDSCTIKEPLIMNPSVLKERNPAGKNLLVIEGTNYNTSLIVMNPRSGPGYGIKEILVNGIKVENINMDVIELSFFKMKIDYQKKVKIEFKFEKDCDPFIIIPEVINY
jgi:hypothetical protein